jgi:hypothetical protein
MLSPTHSLTDIKAYLLSQTTEYGYANSTTLDAGLTLALDRAKILILVPAISEARYDEIEAKDKVGLTDIETAIYMAECMFALSSFLQMVGTKEIQRAAGSTQTLGKSEKGGVPVGKMAVSDYYFREGMEYMSVAGYYQARKYTAENGIEKVWEQNEVHQWLPNFR